MVFAALILLSSGLLVLGSECPEEWTRFQGFCYRVPVGKYSFTEAYDVCQSMGSHPIAIVSPHEQNYVDDIFFRSVGRSLWTSGVRVGPGPGDSSFRWMTGQPFSYTHWARSQPNNYQQNEYCVLLSSGPVDTGMWHDVRCKLKHAVLCKRPIGDTKHNDNQFGDVLKDLYRKYHPAPKADIKFYSPFLVPVTAFACMFTVMSLVFFLLLKFLQSTPLDDQPEKEAKNGAFNKGFV